MEVSNWEIIAGALDSAGIEREVLHLSSKTEILNYYKQEYDGGWKSRLASDIAKLPGETAKASSIERRFRGSRLESGKVTPKAAAQYKAIGQKLPGTVVEKPRNLKGKRARVTTKVSMTISKEKKARNRNIDEVLTPHQMSQLRHGDLTGLIEAYGGINPAEIMTLEFQSPTSVNYL